MKPNVGTPLDVRSAPLLVSANPDVIDSVGRVAAAAGLQCVVATGLADAQPHWSRAGLVLVGVDLAPELAAAGLTRRGDVVLVCDSDTGPVWRLAVEIGAEHVAFLPTAEAWLSDRLADLAEGPPRRGLVVAVIGGRGGAGASTLAVSLALTSTRQGRRTLLCDADPLGGGIDLLLGAEDAPGLRWPGLLDARGRVAPESLRQALPAVSELTVLAWDRGDPVEVPIPAFRSVLDSAIRGFDLVVMDLPRALGPAADEVLARTRRTLLVTTADIRGAASAARVLARLPLVDVGLIVRGPAPGGLTPELVAESLDLPLIGYLRPEPGLAEGVERGEPPMRARGPLADLCAAVLRDLDLARAA